MSAGQIACEGNLLTHLNQDTFEDAAGPDAVKPEDDIPLAASPVRSLTGPNGAGIAGTSGAAAVSIDGTIDNAQGDGGASAATATSQPTSPKAKENRVSVSSLANVELDDNTANANAGPETESGTHEHAKSTQIRKC